MLNTRSSLIVFFLCTGLAVIQGIENSDASLSQEDTTYGSFFTNKKIVFGSSLTFIVVIVFAVGMCLNCGKPSEKQRKKRAIKEKSHFKSDITVIPNALPRDAVVISFEDNYENKNAINPYGDQSRKAIPMTNKVKRLEHVFIESKFADGVFGTVYVGYWDEKKIALKMMTISDISIFEDELEILFKKRHPSIIEFYGKYIATYDSQSYIAFELMTNGDLADFFRYLPKFGFVDLFDMIVSACEGMKFLEQNKIVHRNMAARNLLLYKYGKEQKHQIKISGFGRAHEIFGSFEKTYNDTGVPVRWAAPEVLHSGQFSTASDVWSFGITMWEIVNRGRVPYVWLSNSEIKQYVLKGEKINQPDIVECPLALWQIILSCFAFAPSTRPTFDTLLKQLNSLGKDYHFHDPLDVPPVDARYNIEEEEDRDPLANMTLGTNDQLKSVVKKVTLAVGAFKK